MAYDFSVVTDNLKTLIGDLRSTATQIDGYIKTVEGVYSSNDAGWISPGSAAFWSLFEGTWAPDTMQVATILDSAADSLQKVLDNYISTEGSNTMH